MFLGIIFADVPFVDCFFYQILQHFCFSTLWQNKIWACFCVNLHILGLFFQICLLTFMFIYLLVLCFWISLPNACWACIFLLNYVFRACFSNVLACFYKTTWHHYCRSSNRTTSYDNTAFNLLNPFFRGICKKGYKIL